MECDKTYLTAIKSYILSNVIKKNGFEFPFMIKMYKKAFYPRTRVPLEKNFVGIFSCEIMVSNEQSGEVSL